MTLIAYSPGSPTMAKASASPLSSDVTTCCDWIFGQCRQLIADLGGAFELKLRGRLLHALAQLCIHFLAASLKHLDRGIDVLAIGRRIDQPHAGCRTAPYLVLQARPGAVGEE